MFHVFNGWLFEQLCKYVLYDKSLCLSQTQTEKVKLKSSQIREQRLHVDNKVV